MIRVIVMILSMSVSISAWSQRSLPSDCGAGGCPPTAKPFEVLSAALKAPEVAHLLNDKNIIEIVRDDFYFTESYKVVTETCEVDMRIEYLELPLEIDGVAPISIEPNTHIIVTAGNRTTCE